jgi:hypothetical protein
MDILELDKHFSTKIRMDKCETNSKKDRRVSADSAVTNNNTGRYKKNAHRFIAFASTSDEEQPRLSYKCWIKLAIDLVINQTKV